MFKLDPGKNWITCLFIGAFGLVVLYALWSYIVAAVVRYAIAKAFSNQRHHTKGPSCKRRCRRWSR
jgi:hypothetical protein